MIISIFGLELLLLIILGGCTVCVRLLLCNRLRQRHPQLWYEVGEPTVLSCKRRWFALPAFGITRKGVKTPDGYLRALAEAYSLLFFGGVVIVLCILYSFLSYVSPR